MSSQLNRRCIRQSFRHGWCRRATIRTQNGILAKDVDTVKIFIAIIVISTIVTETKEISLFFVLEYRSTCRSVAEGGAQSLPGVHAPLLPPPSMHLQPKSTRCGRYTGVLLIGV
jgi:hypothetical protein